jgi:tetratricopeptide (TPR) repeat protein
VTEPISPDPIAEILYLAEDGDTMGALARVDEWLAEYPESGVMHALKASLLLDAGRPVDADQSVRLALQHSDDEDPRFARIIAANVALALREPDRVMQYATELLQDDPADEVAIMLEARALALLGKWEDAKHRAEYVLAGDPDHEEAVQLRLAAIESMRGGKAKLSEDEWAAFAAKFPHNAVARTGRAWALLQRGKSRDAEAEFRDALALDPTADWAREGLLITLKARYPGYGLLLRFFDWMQSFAPNTQTMIVFGGIFGFRILRNVARENPAMGVVIYPLLAIYIAFVVASWLADPLLNLLLLAKAEGRALLKGAERTAALLVGAALGTASLAALAGWAFSIENLMLSGLVFGLASFSIAAAYQCAEGKYRTRMQLWAGTVVVLAFIGATAPGDLGSAAIGIGVLLAVIGTWVGRWWAGKSHREG